ncbi:MAG: hypothetical protein JNJ83_05680 [Verrucomicrobiaceae bacterium]|nr:hypothetical protein [Verrucomicrobiaceae bacterium]
MHSIRRGLPRLTDSQRTEIAIGSVNHTLYQCPNCCMTKLLSRRKWFTRFTPCPKCHSHAVMKSERQVAAPTEIHSGKAIASWTCAHCHDVRQAHIVIPALVTSAVTASSFSSFPDTSWNPPSHTSFDGGASSFDSGSSSSASSSDSGGGGASGSW